MYNSNYITIFFFFLIFNLFTACTQNTRPNLPSFEQETRHLLNDVGTTPVDQYSSSLQTTSKNFFVQFIDGQCQLCALDLKEIDNLNKNYFETNKITPLVFIYGKIDPYISDLIDKQNILNFPIFTLDSKRFNYLKEKFGLYSESYLVGENYKLIFKGNPLENENDLKRLSTALNNI